MVAGWPKSRPELPESYQRIYLEHSRQNRGGLYTTTSLSQRLEEWMHRRVAADVAAGAAGSATAGSKGGAFAGAPGQRPSTLEIGAGTLNQLRFEPAVGPYDIVEPYRELYDGSELLARVRRRYADIAEIDPAARYDRITSIAVFEHIPDLPPVVARAALLLADGGTLRVGIPNEGTILWRLGTLVTGFEFKRRYGLDYQVLMRYEHVSTADEIEAVVRLYFGDMKRSVLGLNRRLAVYRYLEAREPLRSEAASALRGGTAVTGPAAASAATPVPPRTR
ncbi:MAG: class I SAM-dependent methyltransferase [Chloroflexota bacterium]